MKNIKQLITLAISIFFFGSFVQAGPACSICDGKGTVKEMCSSCSKGSGVIYCTTCNYSGKVEQRCYSCNGSGTISKTKDKKCYNCAGQKYFRKEQRSSCSCRNGKRPVSRNGQTEYIDCNRCNGRGYLVSYVNEACPVCGGSGHYGTESTTDRCGSCGGSGQTTKTCSKCNGQGAYSCPSCSGYGYKTKTCSRCGGRGYIQ